MVPKDLTEEQKQRRVTISQDLLERQDDVLGHVITGDETWVYHYDPEMKQQNAQWKTANSPRPKKFHRSKSRVKTMLLTFFDIDGLFIMNLYQLDKQSTKFTWPKRFANNSWILHHDNAPAHTALSVREFLATKQITVLEHATYSPDLAPSDFFCSRRYRKY